MIRWVHRRLSWGCYPTWNPRHTAPSQSSCSARWSQLACQLLQHAATSFACGEPKIHFFKTEMPQLSRIWSHACSSFLACITKREYHQMQSREVIGFKVLQNCLQPHCTRTSQRSPPVVMPGEFKAKSAKTKWSRKRMQDYKIMFLMILYTTAKYINFISLYLHVKFVVVYITPQYAVSHENQSTVAYSSVQVVPNAPILFCSNDKVNYHNIE